MLLVRCERYETVVPHSVRSLRETTKAWSESLVQRCPIDVGTHAMSLSSVYFISASTSILSRSLAPGE